jgi:hypothetical protein
MGMQDRVETLRYQCCPCQREAQKTRSLSVINEDPVRGISRAGAMAGRARAAQASAIVLPLDQQLSHCWRWNHQHARTGDRLAKAGGLFLAA